MINLKTGNDSLDKDFEKTNEEINSTLCAAGLLDYGKMIETPKVRKNSNWKTDERINDELSLTGRLHCGNIIEELKSGNDASEYSNQKTNDELCAYDECEIEVDVVNALDNVPYLIGTNNELNEANVDVFEHLFPATTEPVHREMELGMEIVNDVHYTIGTNEELDVVNVDPIEPIDRIITVSPSHAPYRLSIGIDPSHGCNKNEMIVPTSDQGRKKYACYYCQKLVSKLVQHLENVHKHEKDVKAFGSLPPGTAERKRLIAGIRNLGQSNWNKNADINKGVYLPSRRPNSKYPREAKLHEICPNCYAPIYGKNLRQHWNKCTNNSVKRERIVKTLSRAIEKRVHRDACDDLSVKVFPNMHDDDCLDTIRYDWLLVTHGNDLCLNYSPIYQQDLIKRQLRSAGKLLLACRSISEKVTDFASIFHVKNCNTIIEAIRIVSGFDSKTKTFEHPSTAAASVTLMNHIAQLFLVESMKEEKWEQEVNVTRFSTVFQKEAKLKLNKIVGVMKEKSHRERDENIPSAADVERLADYLDTEIDKCYDKLKRKYSFANWVYLAQLTMASIIVFNRRRVGEVKNILVRDFKRRVLIADRYIEQFAEEDPDDSLEKTKRLIKSRMKIRGKLDRAVPVLLKYTTDECLQLLLTHRRKAGVPDENDFIFALPSGPKRLKIIEPCALMRRFSILCGADNPTSLRGTNLRKQFASYCSTVGLTDNDVTNVATYMGHDDKVHRDVYRHNPLRKEIVQMSGLLEGARSGKHFIKSTNADSAIRTYTGSAKRKAKFNNTDTLKHANVGTSKRTKSGSVKRVNTGKAKSNNTGTSKCTATKRGVCGAYNRNNKTNVMTFIKKGKKYKKN